MFIRVQVTINNLTENQEVVSGEIEDVCKKIR
jgi:hypothetical protein